MSRANRGKIPSEMGWLIDLLDDMAERLSTLEAPDGNQIAQTVRTLQALVSDIQAQLDAYNANRYTNAQIDALVDAKVSAAIAAVLAGTVTVGALTVNGSATVGGSATVNGDITGKAKLSVAGDVNMPGVRTRNISAISGRAVTWVGSAGELGVAP